MEHIVTKLTESKNVKDRWYADFDTGESVKLSLALIADFSVYTGRRFEGEEFEALRAAASKMNAKARALRMLGARAMSRRELMDKLLEKGETPGKNRSKGMIPKSRKVGSCTPASRT